MSGDLTAESFVEQLQALSSPEELAKIRRYFKPGEGEDAADVFIGVRMGAVFALAKERIEMPPAEIERLLESPVHEARAGALSVMDKQARRKRTADGRRRELYELYLRRHDRIDNWDLVDLGSVHVVGGYLFDYGESREVLYELVRSDSIWERRTAILVTLYFVRKGDLDDTFRIAELLLSDDEDLIHKPVGGLLREAGKKDLERLRAFLDQHAAAMPRTALRYATEKLDADERESYRARD